MKPSNPSIRTTPVEAAAASIGINSSELARRLGISKGALSQWKSPGRVPPIGHCIAIERMTGGVVTRKDLRPADWHLIWPELVDSKGAPKVKSRKAA